MRSVSVRVLLPVAVAAVAAALASLWIPWLGVAHYECGWTCYVPLTAESAGTTFERLGGPAGRFVAPAAVGVTLAATVAALASVVLTERPAGRRTVLGSASSALVLGLVGIALSIAAEAGVLAHDAVGFQAPRIGSGTSASSGNLGPGIFVAVASALAAIVVAAVAARRGRADRGRA